MKINRKARFCRQCGKTKPVAEFGKHRGQPGGLKYTCKECLQNKRNTKAHKKYMQEYRLINKLRIRELQKAWDVRNPDRKRERNKKYTQKHIKDGVALDRQGHSIRLRKSKSERKRRYLKIGLSIETVQQVYEENIKKHGTLTCYLCNYPVVFGDDTVEHKIPLSRKDEFPEVDINGKENLGIAHGLCNSKKGTKTFEEWTIMQSLKDKGVTLCTEKAIH